MRLKIFFSRKLEIFRCNYEEIKGRWSIEFVMLYEAPQRSFQWSFTFESVEVDVQEGFKIVRNNFE